MAVGQQRGGRQNPKLTQVPPPKPVKRDAPDPVETTAECGARLCLLEGFFKAILRLNFSPHLIFSPEPLIKMSLSYKNTVNTSVYFLGKNKNHEEAYIEC